MDLGSVKLQIADREIFLGHGFTVDQSVGTVWVAGTPEISETRSNIRRRNSPQSPTDPWSIVINVNDHLRNGPGISNTPVATGGL